MVTAPQVKGGRQVEDYCETEGSPALALAWTSRGHSARACSQHSPLVGAARGQAARTAFHEKPEMPEGKEDVEFDDDSNDTPSPQLL